MSQNHPDKLVAQGLPESMIAAAHERTQRILEAYELVKTHPERGHDALRNIEFPWPVAEVVRQHHERLDGSGYPRGLKGEEILLEARIIAVADLTPSSRRAGYSPRSERSDPATRCPSG